MSTATVEEPIGHELAWDEAESLGMNITPDELRMVRTIRSRAKRGQKTEYRKMLERRTAQRRPGTKEEMDKRFPLPGGCYQSYRLAYGRHKRVDEVERQRVEDETKAIAKRTNGIISNPPQPEYHEFIPGDLITPETDGEALMMEQDRMKYVPQGPGQSQKAVDVLEMELNRVRALAAKTEGEKDTEIERLKAELLEAKKKKQ